MSKAGRRTTVDDARWWRESVFYQIYPRSFKDSNGDGVGDIRGIAEKLDYLEWLGIDGVWLNPTMPSPNSDWGYDVSDYKGVHPELGTLEDLDELIAEAHRRGIRILLDFVPNHTSTEHEWFKAAISSPDSPARDYYVWADPKPGGSPPNNWRSAFGGEAWEYDERSGQYYLHNFLDTQADLNWWNEDVRDAMDEVLRFWFDRGVAGFRIDVAHAVIKDRQLRDNLPATESDDIFARRLGQQHTYSMDQPEVHDVIRRWRSLADSYDPSRILVGETFLLDLHRVANYYGKGDELHVAFNFPFVFAPFEAGALRDVVELTEELLPPELAWPVWAGSNHDVLRFPTRWCNKDPRRTRVALIMLLTLRGTPFLYYGDEIGMPDTDLGYEQLLDPVGKRFWPENKGRDFCRTPMQWSATEGAGFTEPGVDPWLPVGDLAAFNVAAQQGDADSILALTRALIALRRRSDDLRRGDYLTVDSPDGTWVYRRGDRTLIALNLSEDGAVIRGAGGVVVLHSDGESAGETVRGNLELDPWSAAIVDERTSG
jgi:alpha-glucosidase